MTGLGVTRTLLSGRIIMDSERNYGPEEFDPHFIRTLAVAETKSLHTKRLSLGSYIKSYCIVPAQVSLTGTPGFTANKEGSG
jgi:hypothetical protein